MKVIEQNGLFESNIDIFTEDDDIVLHQEGGSISISKQGVVELIKVLQEWVDSE